MLITKIICLYLHKNSFVCGVDINFEMPFYFDDETPFFIQMTSA